MKTTLHLKNEFSVSSATINNWVKTGVIPAYPNGLYFEEEEYLAIIDRIKSDFKKLQKRANRSLNHQKSSNTSLLTQEKSRSLVQKISHLYQKSGLDLNGFMNVLACCFLEKNQFIAIENAKIICKNQDFECFLSNWKDETNATIWHQTFSEFNCVDLTHREVDFLGLMYEILRSVSQKSLLGAFFTPSHLVENVKINHTANILDPCAGTGTLLMSVLSKNHLPSKITLYDIDALALKIAKVNFVLFFNDVNAIVQTEVKDILYHNNLVSKNNPLCFDFVVTNPPYGVKLSKQQKNTILINYPQLKTTEIFNIALYNSFHLLNKNGKLHIILPESLLYVDTHFDTRKWLFDLNKNIKITYFGNAFKGVMSKIIRIDMDNALKKSISIQNKNLFWVLNQNILIRNDYRPPFIHERIEIDIIEKILSQKKIFTLKNQCKFGLGIITGNNTNHLKPNTKTLEPIYIGKELEPFFLREAKYGIDFQPKKLQQVAPEHLYRQPKICYRFISDKIITVADENGVLVLNSINFFIPNDKNISIKALSCFLNSDMVSFMYQRLYNTTKVLRNHFENLPIPNDFLENQDLLANLYDKAAQGENIKTELNQLVGKWFGLTDNEICYIEQIMPIKCK